MRPEGRVARKLREMLEGLGFEIRMLAATQGHDRSSPTSDTYRWFASGDHVAMGRCMATIDGWDTMTACVERGFIITRDSGSSYTVHARSVGDARKPKAAWE